VMGWTAVRAPEARSDPRAVMVVLLGVGHVAYGLGAQRQAALWTPLPMASVASVAAFEEGKAQTVRASFADFIWGAREDGAAPLYPALGAMFTDKPGSAGPAVAHVQPGSAAARAGVQQGDILTGIDGVATADKETALFELAKKAWDARVSLEVLRAGAAGAAGAASEKKTLTAVLERPGAPAASPATSSTPTR
jgi:membrane-associated protease RseP (regulator of RpoE activity)